ncbi:unnamed protein product [Prorocentrum cordatum]|uniref:Uncharacterized protein n=1 Tax=Prorocentrum cordatum TaxID=2364126 RepID=A0ABN9TPZ5_9DINO|nr:unnamed protein product [Polarella glacialis]
MWSGGGSAGRSPANQFDTGMNGNDSVLAPLLKYVDGAPPPAWCPERSVCLWKIFCPTKRRPSHTGVYSADEFRGPFATDPMLCQVTLGFARLCIIPDHRPHQSPEGFPEGTSAHPSVAECLLTCGGSSGKC